MSCKHRRHHKSKCKRDKARTGCNRFSGFNACTTLPALLILQQSGLLCNDRAFILILLALMCGGFGSGARECDC